MNKILKREEFITEIYNPMIEKKEYDELTAVNEGLLKNIFGAVKNMFKKDWESIKCDNPEIISIYKQLDDRLKGFSMMKLTKKEQCNQIRQELVNFAYDWYDMKMNHAKENNDDPKLAQSMNFKNGLLKENLENVEKKIKEIAGDDDAMLKWANILKDDMRTVINRSILAEMEENDRKKEMEEKVKKMEEEDRKRQQEIETEMKQMEQEQKKMLEDINKDRNELLSKAGADPKTIKEDLLGDRAIQNLCSSFNKCLDDEGNVIDDEISKDTVFGFKTSFDEEAKKNEGSVNNSFKLMGAFYNMLEKDMKKFNDTPGQSVYAMCIAVNSFIKNCIYNNNDYGNGLPLMAKCAVISDPIVSYNLPLNGKEGDDAGNYFTDTVGKLSTINKQQVNKFKLTDDFDINQFKKNAATLINKIRQEAEKLKNESQKKMDEHNKKLEKLQNKKES